MHFALWPAGTNSGFALRCNSLWKVETHEAWRVEAYVLNCMLKTVNLSCVCCCVLHFTVCVPWTPHCTSIRYLSILRVLNTCLGVYFIAFSSCRSLWERVYSLFMCVFEFQCKCSPMCVCFCIYAIFWWSVEVFSWQFPFLQSQPNLLIIFILFPLMFVQ